MDKEQKKIANRRKCFPFHNQIAQSVEHAMRLRVCLLLKQTTIQTQTSSQTQIFPIDCLLFFCFVHIGALLFDHFALPIIFQLTEHLGSFCFVHGNKIGYVNFILNAHNQMISTIIT